MEYGRKPILNSSLELRKILLEEEKKWEEWKKKKPLLRRPFRPEHRIARTTPGQFHGSRLRLKPPQLSPSRPYRSVEDLLKIPGIGTENVREDQALRDRQELNDSTGRNSWDCRITLR